MWLKLYVVCVFRTINTLLNLLIYESSRLQFNFHDPRRLSIITTLVDILMQVYSANNNIKNSQKSSRVLIYLELHLKFSTMFCWLNFIEWHMNPIWLTRYKKLSIDILPRNTTKADWDHACNVKHAVNHSFNMILRSRCPGFNTKRQPLFATLSTA